MKEVCVLVTNSGKRHPLTAKECQLIADALDIVSPDNDKAIILASELSGLFLSLAESVSRG